MKKFIAGLVIGIVLSVFGTALAAQTAIKLVVNNKPVACYPAPLMIEGRVFVPIRFVADALGQKVNWNGENNTVIIGESPSITSSAGLSRDNPLPFGQFLITSDGYQITVTEMVEGNSAWSIVHEANMFNEPPETGYKYVLINVIVKNISSAKEPETFYESNFTMVGSSNRIFNTFDKSVALDKYGQYKEMDAELYHGGSASGTLSFYVPSTETNYILIYEPTFSMYDIDKRYFAVN